MHPYATGDRPWLGSRIASVKRQRDRCALMKVDSLPLAAITTEPIRPYSPDKDAVERLKLRLLKRHGLPVSAPEARMTGEPVVKGALPEANAFWTAPEDLLSLSQDAITSRTHL